jgi:hypothetical protein
LPFVCHLLIHADKATISLTGDECKRVEAVLPELGYVLDGNTKGPFRKMFKAYQKLSLQMQSLEPFTDDDIKKLKEGWVAFADDWLKLIQPIEFLRSPRNGGKPPKSLSIYVHLFRCHLPRLLEEWRNLARGNQQGVELMHKMVKQNTARHTPHNLPRMDALEHECHTRTNLVVEYLRL